MGFLISFNNIKFNSRATDIVLKKYINLYSHEISKKKINDKF